MNITKNCDFQFSCKEETKWGLNEIDDYYVMIIQKGESIEDKIYNIYDNCSMLCFDDKIGMYYQSDYEEMKKQDYETRSSIYPCKNISIKRHDYYSIPVSLNHYLKMLKGECEFPFKCDIKERIEYDLLTYSVTLIPDGIKKIIESCKNQLKQT